MLDTLFMLIKTVLIMLAVGIGIVVIFYSSYILLLLGIVAAVGFTTYYGLKTSRGY